MKYDYVINIGRFQIFHNGHLANLKIALETANKKVLLFIGSANLAPSFKNPFTFQERIEMIKSCLSDEEINKIVFLPVNDCLNDDHWVRDVSDQVYASLEGNSCSLALMGHHKDKSSYYLDILSYPVVELSNYRGVSSTDLRDLWYSDSDHFESGHEHVPVQVTEWLKTYSSEMYDRHEEEWNYVNNYKQLWLHSPYPVKHVTADAVVTYGPKILVVKRGGHPGKGLYALPGGHVDVDERTIDAAIREVKEETGLTLDRLNKVNEYVSDNPSRSTLGRIITHAYHFDMPTSIINGIPPLVPGDDAQEAEWVEIEAALRMPCQFHDDHHQIIQHFMRRYSIRRV